MPRARHVCVTLGMSANPATSELSMASHDQQHGQITLLGPGRRTAQRAQYHPLDPHNPQRFDQPRIGCERDQAGWGVRVLQQYLGAHIRGQLRMDAILSAEPMDRDAQGGRESGRNLEGRRALPGFVAAHVRLGAVDPFGQLLLRHLGG